MMNNYTKSEGYFFENSIFVKGTLFYANAMGYICSNPLFCIDRDKYYDLLIMYLISGKLTVEQYGKIIVLKPGEFILMTLEDKHKYYSDNFEPCEVIWLHFGGKECDELISAYFTNEIKLPLKSISEPIFQVLKRCFSMSEIKNINEKLTMSLNIYEMIITTLMIIKENNNKSNNFKYGALINQIDKYISSNIQKKITLAELAEYVNISQYHFARTFKKATGKSPIQYALDKKIIKAKYLLAYTDKKIVEISKELGFSDQSHFSRVFHQSTSVYPGKYRKEKSFHSI